MDSQLLFREEEKGAMDGCSPGGMRKDACDKKAVDKDRKELTRKYMLDGVNTQIII